MKELPHLSSQCSGCAACANACSQGAITMQTDEYGFIKAKVNPDVCIRCGLCMRVCPDLQPSDDVDPMSIPEQLRIYAAWTKGDILRTLSSSGGVFTTLARQILKENGCIAGVVMDKELQAYHTIAETDAQLTPMRGSKYVQSNPRDVHQRVKEALKNGRRVLFSGTPCQVKGLKSYLGKLADSDLLLTVDIICHGVPSRKIFDKYIEYKEARMGKKIVSARFRSKTDTRWEQFHMAVESADGDVLSTNHHEDYFMRGFLSDIALNDCCYTCKYAKMSRVGDITLGDFWGVVRINPAFNGQKNKGISLLMVNTPKGQAAIESLGGAIERHEISTQDVVEKALPVHVSRPRHPKRVEFLHDLDTKPYPLVIDEYTSACAAKRDIALMGCWFNDNYGAVLTGYSLYKQLTDMGRDVTMIGQDNGFGCKKKEIIVLPVLKQENVNYKIYPVKTDFSRLNIQFSTFMVGSDQLWSRYIRDYTYYLDFARGDKRKIAYGTSLGDYENPYSQAYADKARLLLHRFDAISSREKSAPAILKERFGVEAEHVCDPVFLTPKKYWEAMAEKSDREIPEGDYCACYILDPNDEVSAAISTLSKDLKLPTVGIVDRSNDEKVDKLKIDGVLRDVSVYDWLRIFSKSKCIVTDSFHGACFAIILGKPFVCMCNAARGLARFHSLIDTFHLKDRFVFKLVNPEHYHLLNQALDNDALLAVIKETGDKSLAWLKNALDKPRSPEFVLAGLNTDVILKQAAQQDVAAQKISAISARTAALVPKAAPVSTEKWETKEYIRLFHFLPFLRILKSKTHWQIWLFFIIPLLKVKIREKDTRYMLFWVIPFFSTRSKGKK